MASMPCRHCTYMRYQGTSQPRYTPHSMAGRVCRAGTHHALRIDVRRRHLVDAEGIVGGVGQDVGLHAVSRALLPPAKRAPRPSRAVQQRNNSQRRSHLHGMPTAGAVGLDGCCDPRCILQLFVWELQGDHRELAAAYIIRRRLHTPLRLIQHCGHLGRA